MVFFNSFFFEDIVLGIPKYICRKFTQRRRRQKRSDSNRSSNSRSNRDSKPLIVVLFIGIVIGVIVVQYDIIGHVFKRNGYDGFIPDYMEDDDYVRIVIDEGNKESIDSLEKELKSQGLLPEEIEEILTQGGKRNEDGGLYMRRGPMPKVRDLTEDELRDNAIGGRFFSEIFETLENVRNKQVKKPNCICHPHLDGYTSTSVRICMLWPAGKDNDPIRMLNPKKIGESKKKRSFEIRSTLYPSRKANTYNYPISTDISYIDFDMEIDNYPSAGKGIYVDPRESTTKFREVDSASISFVLEEMQKVVK